MKPRGRPPGVGAANIARVAELRKDGVDNAAIAARLGLAHQTVLTYAHLAKRRRLL